MKVSQFKSIIKDAVREILQEELQSILREELVEFGKVLTESVKPKTNKFDYREMLTNNIPTKSKSKTTQPQPTGDPMMDMLLETKNNMTMDDYRDVGGFTTGNMGMMPAMGMGGIDPDVNPSTMMEDSSPSMANLPDFSSLMNR